MKTYIFAVALLCSAMQCEEKILCSEFNLNQPFTARIDEKWCLESSDWNITFGPFIEDSRCNVPGIDCIWAGRYVMGVTIDNGQTIQDTFFAQHNWSDTLYNGGYQIILAKVYPETRPTMEPLNPSEYSFDIIVK